MKEKNLAVLHRTSTFCTHTVLSFPECLILNSNNAVSKPYKINNCKAYILDVEDLYGASVSFNLRNMSMKPPSSITNCYDNCLFFSEPLKQNKWKSIFILEMVTTLSLVSTFLLTNDYRMCFPRKPPPISNLNKILVSQKVQR